MGGMSHVTTERRFLHVLASQLPLLPGRGDLEGHIQDASDQLKYLAFVVSLDLCSSFLTSTTTPAPRRTHSTRPPHHPPQCPSGFRNTAVPNKSGMKSCLKLTPPLTPQSSSYANSPVASGSSSPVLGPSPLPSLARKTVSFCDDQEFYEADDWDRSPAPVAPKLGYQ